MAHAPLPDNLLSRLHRTAQQDGLSLTRLFEKMLDAYLATRQQSETVDAIDSPKSAYAAQSLDPLYAEAAAFLKLHPSLLENYPNHYVAIYQGQLIDHDVNKLALYERIEETYPSEFVLMRPVQAQPEREFHFHSLRYIERI